MTFVLHFSSCLIDLSRFCPVLMAFNLKRKKNARSALKRWDGGDGFFRQNRTGNTGRFGFGIGWAAFFSVRRDGDTRKILPVVKLHHPHSRSGKTSSAFAEATAGQASKAKLKHR